MACHLEIDHHPNSDVVTPDIYKIKLLNHICHNWVSVTCILWFNFHNSNWSLFKCSYAEFVNLFKMLMFVFRIVYVYYDLSECSKWCLIKYNLQIVIRITGTLFSINIVINVITIRVDVIYISFIKCIKYVYHV